MRGYDRGYDYGLRGFRQTSMGRNQVRTRFVGGGYGGDYRGGGGGAYGSDYDRPRGGYGGDYGSRYRPNPLPNRVTAAYNLDYVREQHPGERPVNYAPYGGDREGRVGDMREYWSPYQTIGGTRTWRGGWPMGWEREHASYDWQYPNYRGDYGRWF